jgi:hypothetical protein
MGTPVIGSRRDLKCDMVHDGDILRSEDEFGEVINIGISGAETRSIFDSRKL